jgi:hypothetical protein
VRTKNSWRNWLIYWDGQFVEQTGNLADPATPYERGALTSCIRVYETQDVVLDRWSDEIIAGMWGLRLWIRNEN